MRTLAALLLLASPAAAADYVVTSKLPPAEKFAVTSRLPAPAPAPRTAPDPPKPAKLGPPPGRHAEYDAEGREWWVLDGYTLGTAGNLPQRAVGGAAVAPFRGPGYHAGHACPACGTAQFVVSGYNPEGTHTHTCPRCGTSWKH